MIQHFASLPKGGACHLKAGTMTVIGVAGTRFVQRAPVEWLALPGDELYIDDREAIHFWCGGDVVIPTVKPKLLPEPKPTVRSSFCPGSVSGLHAYMPDTYVPMCAWCGAPPRPTRSG